MVVFVTVIVYNYSMSYKFKCPTCGEEFSTTRSNQKFCSRQCYGWGQTLGLSSHKPRFSITRICQLCGKNFVRHRPPDQWNPAIYCSQNCANKAQGLQRVINRIDARGEEYKDIEKFREYEKCVICEYDRFVELCKIIPGMNGGIYSWNNTIYLCPNHHRLFDNHLLLPDELAKLTDNIALLYNSGLSYPYSKLKGM